MLNSLNSGTKKTSSPQIRDTYNQNSPTSGKLMAFPGQTDIHFLTELNSSPSIDVYGTQKSDRVTSKDPGHILNGAPKLFSPLSSIIPTQNHNSKIKMDETMGPKANCPLLEQMIHADYVRDTCSVELPRDGKTGPIGHPIAKPAIESKQPAIISIKGIGMTPAKTTSRSCMARCQSPALTDLSPKFTELNRISLEEKQRILDWEMGELGGKSKLKSTLESTLESESPIKILRTQLSDDDSGVSDPRSKFFLERKAIPST
jgi:hypothetical protein